MQNMILIQMKNILPFLPQSERLIASHLLENPRDAITCSARELAEQCGTSQAAVVRFCKSLELSGYRELTSAISGTLEESSFTPKPIRDIRPGDSVSDIIQTVSSNNVSAILETTRLVDPEILCSAANRVYSASKILICGFGASLLAAQDLEEKLLRISLPAVCFADYTLQRTAAANFDETSVVIAISWSGTTRELIGTVNAAKEAGATIVSITKYGRSKLSQLSDYPLFASAPENRIRFGAMSSRIAQYNLVDLLFSVLVSSHYDQIRPSLEKTHHALSGTKYL